MSARDEILADIRARRVKRAPRPSPYPMPPLAKEAIEQFVDRARASGADVKRLASLADIPQAVVEALRDRNLPAILHLPPGEDANAPEWSSVPGLTLTHTLPGPDDAAIAESPYAIAETGTLAYSSHAERPASWHFRPGLEIAVLRAESILPHFESVLARVKRDGTFPATLNLVTGPSRTGDIEQTLAVGAHGPKALVILVLDRD